MASRGLWPIRVFPIFETLCFKSACGIWCGALELHIMKAQLAIQKILRERFVEFQAKNPAYSIRAFSKRAGLSPATLSLVLNGKRRISHKLADLIAQKL